MTENEQRLQVEIDGLRAENAVLRAQVVELLERLNRNSSNPSKSPSSDPPWHVKPKPPRQPTGKKPGAQPGHKPHKRTVLEPTQGEEFDCLLEQCPHCRAVLDDSTVVAGKEALHQVTEVVSAPRVTNYFLTLHKCGGCGRKSRGRLPRGVPPTATGPRLQAIVTMLMAQCHLRRVDVKEAILQMFGVNLSVGAIHAVGERAAMGVKPAIDDVARALVLAATKHCDETGWRHCNKLAWLWGVTAKLGAYFHIDPRRNREALSRLLPELHGVIHTDRWGVYDIIDVPLHQLCHAHLRRDMQALVDLKDSAGELGTVFLAASDAMFHVWHRFRAGELTRAQLQSEMAPVQSVWRALATQTAAHEHKKVRALGRDLIKQWDSLWPFLAHEGAEATNNTAERVVRPPVLLRKINGGTHCDTGAEFVSRLQSVIVTAKCQGVRLVDWLTRVFEALWAPVPLPRLLPPATG